MILILSIEQDLTTDHVIDWLVGFGTEFIRINDSSIVSFASYNQNTHASINLIYKNILEEDKAINIHQIKTYWYRRGFLNFKIIPCSFDISDSIVFDKLSEYISKSRNFMVQSLFFELSKKKHLGSFNDNYINKLNVLSLASSIGLSIPDTEIINTKQRLNELLNVHKQLITKGIDNNFWGDGVSFEVNSSTVLLSEGDLKDTPEVFEYSLVQPLVEKYCEIRTFYLDGECYSSAIFSQGNDKTKIDYRNYDHDNPNRNVPYLLPKDISDKIKILMKTLKFNTGSLDLILTPENRLVFLEVNPVGQFGGVSFRCNYYLEKKLATFLTICN